MLDRVTLRLAIGGSTTARSNSPTNSSTQVHTRSNMPGCVLKPSVYGRQHGATGVGSHVRSLALCSTSEWERL